MRRLILSLLAALALTTVAGGAALAGGSAIVIPDEATDEPIAGEPLVMGFTLLQHGVTPVDEGVVEVVLTGRAGDALVVGAEPQGNGRWLATATVPSEGDWSWTVRMPGGLEIIPMRDTPSFTVVAAAQPLNAALLIGGLLASFAALLAMLVLASRPSAPRSASRPAPGGAQRTA